MLIWSVQRPTILSALLATFVLGWEIPAKADALGELVTPFRDALLAGQHTTALGFIFLAGLATALTPCVYPMIAITVSVFGARKTESRLQGALLSTAFVMGMATLFTPLGLISAISGNGVWKRTREPVGVVRTGSSFYCDGFEHARSLRHGVAFVVAKPTRNNRWLWLPRCLRSWLRQRIDRRTVHRPRLGRVAYRGSPQPRMRALAR